MSFMGKLNKLSLATNRNLIESYKLRLLELILARSEQRSPIPDSPVPVNDDDGDEIDLAGFESDNEVVSPREKRRQEVEDEFKRFRKRVFNTNDNPLAFFASLRHEFPNCVDVCQAIFSIPGSQMENERIFSISGILTKGRRNGLGVNNP
jgi:hypothetical protein